MVGCFIVQCTSYSKAAAMALSGTSSVRNYKMTDRFWKCVIVRGHFMRLVVEK